MNIPLPHPPEKTAPCPTRAELARARYLSARAGAAPGLPHSSASQKGVLTAYRRKKRRSTLIIRAGAGLGMLALLALCAAAAFWAGKGLPASLVKHAAQTTVTPTTAGDSGMISAIIQSSPAAQPLTLLVMGSDQRSGDPGFRTDVMMLVFVRPSDGTLSAVSFPRDLWVETPGYDPMKINTVQGVGGFEATQAMFEYTFGVRPDHYILTNFEGFTRMINSLGGVEVGVTQDLTDQCDLPWANAGGQCSAATGQMHMDGATALWYVRSRHSSSDFDRLRRAQEVLWAAFQQTMSAGGVTRAPEFYAAWKDSVETDLSPAEIVPYLPAAARLAGDPARVRRYAVSEELTGPFWTWNGMWALWPDREGIRQLLQEAQAGE